MVVVFSESFKSYFHECLLVLINKTFLLQYFISKKVSCLFGIHLHCFRETQLYRHVFFFFLYKENRFAGHCLLVEVHIKTFSTFFSFSRFQL